MPPTLGKPAAEQSGWAKAGFAIETTDASVSQGLIGFNGRRPFRPLGQIRAHLTGNKFAAVTDV